jgi:hypothetical protein
LITSALKRLAAVSNEILVLVESSKKRFTTVLPRKVGSLRFGPSEMAAMYLAVVIKSNDCSLVKSFTDSKF